MNRIRVKICGVTSARIVEAAVDAGADAIGMVMSASPRQVDLETASALMALLPPWTAAVAVTRQPQPGFADQILAALRPAWWQTDRADLEGQQPPAGTMPLAVIREGEDTTVLPPWFVYEGEKSGHGDTVDWTIAARLARRGRMILAGGLTPDNVAAAIVQVRPYGVDVSSGVERARGVKDVTRINDFIAAVRNAERELEYHA